MNESGVGVEDEELAQEHLREIGVIESPHMRTEKGEERVTIHPTINKERTFALLKARGVKKAVLTYNGGNDEGGVDDITFHLALENGETTEIDFPIQWSATGDDKVLAELLESPVDAKYGSWAGEFSAYGSLTWDVEAGTVVMDDYVQDEYRNEREEW